MFFSRKVPPAARDAYGKDAMAGMLAAIMMGLTGPFVMVIARDQLKASALEMGVLSMAPVAGNLFSLLWANCMEGRRKMPFAVGPWTIARAMFILVFFARDSFTFVVVIAALNFIASVAGPAYSALMKEVYPDGDRARIMGYARVCTWSVFVLVTAVSAPLLAVVSYQYVFPVAGMIGIVSARVFNKIHAKETSGDSSVPLHSFARDSIMILKEDPGFRWFCAGIFMFGFANFAAAPIYAIYQVDVLHVDTRWAGAYSIIASITMIAAYFFWGARTDRTNPEKLIALQALVWAFIPLNYVFAHSAWMLIPATVIGGVIGAGVELSYFNGVLHFAPDERITHYQAVFLSLMGLRGLVAPFVGAWLVQTHVLSMQGLFIICAGLIAGSSIVQVMASRRYRTLRAEVRHLPAGSR